MFITLDVINLIQFHASANVLTFGCQSMSMRRGELWLYVNPKSILNIKTVSTQQAKFNPYNIKVNAVQCSVRFKQKLQRIHLSPLKPPLQRAATFVPPFSDQKMARMFNGRQNQKRLFLCNCSIDPCTSIEQLLKSNFGACSWRATSALVTCLPACPAVCLCNALRIIRWPLSVVCATSAVPPRWQLT